MLKPQFKTTAKSKDKLAATFVLEPLEQGYAHTLGNALRRCLLSSIMGRSITGVKINGVRHQFSTLTGLKEDIIEFILNLKQVVIKSDSQEPLTLKLSVKGPREVKAKDIKTPANVEIVNPDLILANLSDKKSKLEFELYSKVGFGYVLAEEHKKGSVGVIATDSAFSPIVQVNYRVESARVGRRTDFEKLILEIKTNGSLDPEDVLNKAANTLVLYFKQIYNPVFEKVEEEKKPEIEENAEILNLTVEELDLPTRIANALRKGGYPTVRDLAKAKKEEISKVKNLGGKSLDIIKEKLAEKEVEVFNN